MRETRSSGSVEGVMSNRDPYSDFMMKFEALRPIAMLTVRADKPVGI